MILHADHGFRGEVWDLDDNRPVPKVIWLDTVPRADGLMHLEAWQVDAEGDCIPDGCGSHLTYRARGRFKFIPRMEKNGKAPDRIKLGAERCERCGDPRTIPGKELCVFCNAYDKGLKCFNVKKMTAVVFDLSCQQPGCGKLAEYQVADEVEVSPAIVTLKVPRITPSGHTLRTGRIGYDRGTLVGRRWWCSKHYRPPRILDDRGEVVRELESSLRP